jgi:hypothetical protein
VNGQRRGKAEKPVSREGIPRCGKQFHCSASWDVICSEPPYVNS